MKAKKSEYRCFFFSRQDKVLAMEQLTALINMGRKYLSDTYGSDEDFYKITSFSYGEEGCSVDFVDNTQTLDTSLSINTKQSQRKTLQLKVKEMMNMIRNC